MKRWVPWLVAVLAFALFASLGRWQWGRAHEKQAMLDAQAATLSARRPVPPASLADPVRRLDWIALEGEFDDAPPVLLDNQLREGRAGVRAYRLFSAQGATLPVLVELGWLPLPPDRRLPTIERPGGRHAVEGLLLPPPSAGFALGSAATAQPDGSLLLMRLEPATLAAALGASNGIAPRVLRLDPALALGYERDLDVLTNTLPPEKHRGYAVQWWGLATAVLVIALVLGLRRRRSPA